MYAEIVVNHPSRAVDRVFDYRIPDELNGTIRVGTRVIVPFSRNNAEKEGYVLRVKENTDAKRIKEIIGISSCELAFKPDMVELIEFMHNRYLAPYIELIHTIIPTGTSIKTVEWVVLDGVYSGKNKTDIRILELISDNGGGMDIYSLSSYFDVSIKSRITALEKQGIVRREFRHTRDINKRKIRAVRICADDERVEEYMGNTRSKIQKRMLMILKDNELISTADIVRFSMGNYSALSSLVKNGIAEFFDIETERSVYDTNSRLTVPPIPTDEQKKAISEIKSAVDNKSDSTILLHGVTGS